MYERFYNWHERYDNWLWLGVVALCFALGVFVTLRGIRAISQRRFERSFRSGTYYYGQDAIVLGSLFLIMGLAAMVVAVDAIIERCLR